MFTLSYQKSTLIHTRSCSSLRSHTNFKKKKKEMRMKKLCALFFHSSSISFSFQFFLSSLLVTKCTSTLTNSSSSSSSFKYKFCVCCLLCFYQFSVSNSSIYTCIESKYTAQNIINDERNMCA